MTKPISKSMNFGSDAVIKMTIFVPDQEPAERIVKLKNFIGNSLGSQRNPEVFIESIKQALRAKFGNIVE